jgi:hypothetical protein
MSRRRRDMRVVGTMQSGSALVTQRTESQVFINFAFRIDLINDQALGPAWWSLTGSKSLSKPYPVPVTVAPADALLGQVLLPIAVE